MHDTDGKDYKEIIDPRVQLIAPRRGKGVSLKNHAPGCAVPDHIQDFDRLEMQLVWQ